MRYLSQGYKCKRYSLAGKQGSVVGGKNFGKVTGQMEKAQDPNHLEVEKKRPRKVITATLS